MSLKTDYKNDKFVGVRKYKLSNNADNTISLQDVTQYEQEGDVFSADDINSTNHAINEATTSINAIKKSIDVTLKASSWSSSSPYSQIISVSGITSASVPIPGLKYPSSYTKQKKNEIDRCTNMITDIETQNGTVVFKCQFDKPTTDLIITLKGV